MPTKPITIHNNRQAFLDLAKAGLKVFPVTQDKRPLVKWKTEATTDLATIERWIRKHPNAMPAMPTGLENGIAALDLDRKNGKDGFATMKALGFDPDTLSQVIVETPTGGGHLVFRHIPGLRSSAGQIGPGVDVRAEGGFIVAAGAVNGKGVYRLLSGSLTDDLPLFPKALIPRLKAKDVGQGEPTGLPFHIITAALMTLPNDGNAFASRDAWLRIGMALHAETDGSEDGLQAFQEWSGQWPGHNAGATETAWESFRAGGGVTGWAIIHEAEGYGWRDPVVTHLLWLSDFDNLMTAEEEAAIDDMIAAPKEDAPAPPSRGLIFLTPAECALLPARPYVIKGLVAQGDVAAIVGTPGAGKSLLAPRLGYAVAQGGEVFGRRTRQGGVFYVAAEDGHGMRGRLSALRQDHGEADAFHLVGGVSDLLSKGGQLKALRAEVKARRPSLVIIDTLAMAFPGLEENSAEGMGQVVAAARSLTTWDAAVVLIHHTTKADDGLPRGHSLLNGALDMSLALTKDKTGMVTGSMSKNRNGPSDVTLAFTIGTRTVGKDEDGLPLKAAICEEMEGRQGAIAGGQLTGQKAVAFDILTRLAAGGKWIAKADWRSACHESAAFSTSDDQNGKNKAFRRAVEELCRAGKVQDRDDLFTSVTAVTRITAGSEDFTDDMQP